MSKRTFISLGLLLVFIIVIYVAFGTQKKQSIVIPEGGYSGVTELTFEDFSFNVPDTDIAVSTAMRTLTPGSSRYYAEFDEGEGVAGTLVVLDEHKAYMSGDTSKVIVPIAVNFGGSGEFVYLAYITKDEKGNYVHQNSIFVGDRITITNTKVIPIASSDTTPNALVFSYMTRSIDVPYSADPNIPAEVFISIRDGKAIEMSRITNGELGEVSLENPLAQSSVQDTFIVKGLALGPWFFEANLPISIEDMTGQTLLSTYSTAQGEWMTTGKVPFETEITLPKNTPSEFKLVIKNDNPSGDAIRDKRFEIILNK